jgi:hypothetical protein
MRCRWRSRPPTARSWTAASRWAQVRSRRQLEARRPAVHRRPPTTRLRSPGRRHPDLQALSRLHDKHPGGQDRGRQPARCPNGHPWSGAKAIFAEHAAAKAGASPVAKQSGKASLVHFRWAAIHPEPRRPGHLRRQQPPRLPQGGHALPPARQQGRQATRAMSEKQRLASIAVLGKDCGPRVVRNGDGHPLWQAQLQTTGVGADLGGAAGGSWYGVGWAQELPVQVRGA